MPAFGHRTALLPGWCVVQRAVRHVDKYQRGLAGLGLEEIDEELAQIKHRRLAATNPKNRDTPEPGRPGVNSVTRSMIYDSIRYMGCGVNAFQGCSFPILTPGFDNALTIR